MSKPVQVTDESFESDVKKSKLPVVVDFWAAWCGPCKVIAPVLEDIAAQFDGKVKIAKMDVDSNPKTPASFSIMSIPSLLFFKNGEVVDQVVGVRPKAQLVEKIEKFIG